MENILEGKGGGEGKGLLGEYQKKSVKYSVDD